MVCLKRSPLCGERNNLYYIVYLLRHFYCRWDWGTAKLYGWDFELNLNLTHTDILYRELD